MEAKLKKKQKSVHSHQSSNKSNRVSHQNLQKYDEGVLFKPAGNKKQSDKVIDCNKKLVVRPLLSLETSVELDGAAA